MYSFGLIQPKSKISKLSINSNRFSKLLFFSYLVKDHFGVSQGTVNLLTSLNTCFLFISGKLCFIFSLYLTFNFNVINQIGPIVSGLSKQFGIRAVVMAAAVVTALMYVISAYSTSIYLMMAAFGVIGGISTGCTYISSLIIVAKYFDKLKGVTTGITMCLGAFAMAPVTTFFLNRFDWQTTLIALAALLLQCTVFKSEINIK